MSGEQTTEYGNPALRASELIRLLTEMRDKHGDLLVYSRLGYSYVGVVELEVNPIREMRGDKDTRRFILDR